MEDSTKIVTGLSEFKEEKNKINGLLRRIMDAKTETDINYLLKIGTTYKKVSAGTIKKWTRASIKRLKEIKSK